MDLRYLKVGKKEYILGLGDKGNISSLLFLSRCPAFCIISTYIYGIFLFHSFTNLWKQLTDTPINSASSVLLAVLTTLTPKINTIQERNERGYHCL